MYHCRQHDRHCSVNCHNIQEAFASNQEPVHPEARYYCDLHNRHCKATCTYLKHFMDKDELDVENDAVFLCQEHRDYCVATDCLHVEELLSSVTERQEDLTLVKAKPEIGSHLPDDKDPSFEKCYEAFMNHRQIRGPMHLEGTSCADSEHPLSKQGQLNEVHVSGNEETEISNLYRVTTSDQESTEVPSGGPDSRGKQGSREKAAISDLHKVIMQNH